jgi:radical SAM superfamily enzyme YgiQ (UPF0313 family)
MKVVVANALGRLANGKFVYAFPSRWDGAWHAGRRGWTHYPYELAYLSTLLKRELPDEVVFLDGNHEGLGETEYIKRLSRELPDVMVTEASVVTYEPMTRIAQALKQRCQTATILTGPVGTYDPKRAIAAGWDYVVPGEYEAKVLAILKGQDPPATYIDLDWLPWPEDQDISRAEYQDPHTMSVFPGHIQAFATRGCPLSCTFCAVPLYYGGHNRTARSHRQRDPHDVCDEIEYLAGKYPTFTGCFFNEETHNANVGWLEQFCHALIRRGLNRYSYDAMCGYWPMTEELIALCAEAGYKEFRLGVESLEESTGKSIHKRVDKERFQRVLNWCKQYGIMVYGTFQCGAPGSTADGDAATIRQAKQWRQQGLLQHWQCSISTPQPGTPFYAEAQKKQWLTTEDLSRYNGVEPVISYPHYPSEDIYANWCTSR